jgi:hypothetical protein
MMESILPLHDDYCHLGSVAMRKFSYKFQFDMLPPYSEEKFKVKGTSEMSLKYNQTACRHIPEEDIQQGHHCGKRKISRF